MQCVPTLRMAMVNAVLTLRVSMVNAVPRFESGSSPRGAGIRNKHDQRGAEIEIRMVNAVPILRMRMVNKAGD